MSSTPITIQSALADRSGFNDLPPEEQILMLEEIGSLALESALLRFLLEQEESEQKKFEQYVTEHIAEEQFLENLYQQYPEFETILQDEVIALRKQSEKVFSVAA